ncbi:MAG TPA: LysR substrate-binding domain-containing protein [Paracoccaceae bacterium]
MDNDLDLAALRAFRAVAREGSFTAASLALRVPKSTVSKRVADLEADLGVRLIERTTRQIRVTTEGGVLAARADRLLGEAEDIRRFLTEAGTEPRGHLRIAVPMLMGHMLMGRIAARFRARYPEITLECLFLDRPPDLLEEGYDGALRFGPLDESGQVARVIQHGVAVLAAAPDLPLPDDLQHPRELADLPLIGMAPPWADGWPLARSDGETYQLKARPGLSLGSFLAMRDAAAAGAGITLLPFLLAGPEFDSGRLRRVLPDWSGQPKTMYFVYPSPQSATMRLRLFIDFLVAELRRQDARIGGDGPDS